MRLLTDAVWQLPDISIAGNLLITETIDALENTYTTYTNATSHTFADGNQLEWVYDAPNMVTEVQYDGDQVLNQDHESGYRLTSQTFGNNLTRSLTYNRDDNLRTNDKVTGIAGLNFDYTYAADKNVLSETSTAGVLKDLGGVDKLADYSVRGHFLTDEAQRTTCSNLHKESWNEDMVTRITDNVLNQADTKISNGQCSSAVLLQPGSGVNVEGSLFNFDDSHFSR